VRRTPTLSGRRVAWDLLRNGLSIEGAIEGSETDIARARVGRRTLFFLRHPDYVDHVLHDGADAYEKSLEYELLRTVLGLNLFTDEGDSWRRHRMMLNPLMAKRHVRGMCDLMVGPIEQYVTDLEEQGDGTELEMAGAMTALTLDVVGAALFGHQFGPLARKMKSVVTGGLRAAEVATRVLMVAAPPAWWIRATAAAIHRGPTLPRGFNTAQWVMRTIDEAVWDVIHERQEHPTDADDLLNLLLNAEDEHGRLPLRRVRDEATTFMLAGHETTANAMTWMWYLLARNPEARDRMLEEVDGVLGDRRPTAADVPALPWTTACVEESMRMFPPAWSIPRTAVRDDVIDGHRIPRGATVIMPVHAIHHDERWWPDPERFDPSRFLPENARGRHRSAYIPFGGGRRICIGTSFALMETTLITAMVSRRFTFDVVPGHPVEPEATLTLRPRHGIKMIARRRPTTPAAAAA
jgi:cytochrome P450